MDNIKSPTKKWNKDSDVEEIYLSNRSLEVIPDTGHYKNLKRLYLNNNKIYRIGQCLRQSYILTELYLQENMLIEITGTLQHLTCLQILLLHSNQLKDITNVVYEMRYMLDLRILNLFLNPCAHEYNYRDYVIHSIPSLELFDRKAITEEERKKVFKKYNPEACQINDSIAFGRRIVGVPKPRPEPTYHLIKATMNEAEEMLNEPETVVIEAEIKPEPDEKYAQAIETRAKKRSVNVYKTFSWVDILDKHQTSSLEIDQHPIMFTAKFK